MRSPEKREEPFLRKLGKLYECRLSTFEATELQKEALNLKHTDDIFIASQVAFIFIAHQPNEDNGRYSMNVLNKVRKNIRKHKYGPYVDYLVAKYTAKISYHIYPWHGAKAWKENTKKHMTAFAELVASKWFDEFDEMYPYELKELFNWNTKNHYKFCRDIIKAKANNPWIAALAKAYYKKFTLNYKEKKKIGQAFLECIRTK
ncbi:MAG: hypothetical protein NE334_04390 [Lentisphaeraceae bacterium]|nr:hypothetical protein [Lentisphaeraceae bacterium]